MKRDNPLRFGGRLSAISALGGISMRQESGGTALMKSNAGRRGGVLSFDPDTPPRNAARWIDRSGPKRVVDIFGATAILVFFLPVLVLIGLAIWMQGKGGVFFRHERLGRNGKPFRCLKFRTMHPASDRILADCLQNDPERQLEWTQTQKLRCDPRVTLLGGMLRKSSLDELPQLINVLRGEMSLVGPRPIVSGEAAHYGDALDHCLTVLPGITGLWQVSGRSDTTYSQRVALDAAYVRDRTMAGDIRILLRTVKVVITGHGAY